jgi:hypothetical protein
MVRVQIPDLKVSLQHPRQQRRLRLQRLSRQPRRKVIKLFFLSTLELSTESLNIQAKYL